MLKKIFAITLLSLTTIYTLGQEKNDQEEEVKTLSQNVIDYMTIPGPIMYKGEEFFLAWSKQNSETWFQQQYIKKDDDFDNYQELINISFFNKEIDMIEAAKMKIKSIETRKEKVEDDYSFVEVIESPDGNEIIVDYLVTIVPKDKEPYTEYNMDRFKTIKTEKGNGLIIMTISKRIYGDLRSASREVKKSRNKLLETVITTPIPSITLK